MIVVDSNVLAARNLTSEHTTLAQRVEQMDSLWIVPPVWRYEFQNILAKGIWVRQFTVNDASNIWQTVMTGMADNEYEPSYWNILDLSARHRITAYDANFIALAVEMDVMCVTEDRELQKKFPAIAVSMGDFIGRAGKIREPRSRYNVRKRR